MNESNTISDVQDALLVFAQSPVGWRIHEILAEIKAIHPTATKSDIIRAIGFDMKATAEKVKDTETAHTSRTRFATWNGYRATLIGDPMKGGRRGILRFAPIKGRAQSRPARHKAAEILDNGGWCIDGVTTTDVPTVYRKHSERHFRIHHCRLFRKEEAEAFVLRCKLDGEELLGHDGHSLTADEIIQTMAENHCSFKTQTWRARYKKAADVVMTLGDGTTKTVHVKGGYLKDKQTGKAVCEMKPTRRYIRNAEGFLRAAVAAYKKALESERKARAVVIETAKTVVAAAEATVRVTAESTEELDAFFKAFNEEQARKEQQMNAKNTAANTTTEDDNMDEYLAMRAAAEKASGLTYAALRGHRVNIALAR